MPRHKIRTKSGRLRKKERDRRINAANPQPGEVVIIDVARRKSSGGKRLRNGMQAELRVAAQFAVDLDARKLTWLIRARLAEHYSASLFAGQKADGRGPLKALRDRPANRGRTRAVKSGEMARKWMLLKVTGGALLSRTGLKPWGGDGRNFMINNELERGIDYQSISGEAAEVLAAATEEWLQMAVGARDGVATPRSVQRSATTLDKAT